jgi:hypothetical protein
VFVKGKGGLPHHLCLAVLSTKLDFTHAALIADLLEMSSIARKMRETPLGSAADHGTLCSSSGPVLNRLRDMIRQNCLTLR